MTVLPAHECECLLSLHLCALRGQLLLLMGEGLLHQHHLDALLHGIFLGLANQVMLLRCQLGQGASQQSQQCRPCARSKLHIARLFQIIQWLRKVGNFRIR